MINYLQKFQKTLQLHTKKIGKVGEIFLEQGILLHNYENIYLLKKQKEKHANWQKNTIYKLNRIGSRHTKKVKFQNIYLQIHGMFMEKNMINEVRSLILHF